MIYIFVGQSHVKYIEENILDYLQSELVKFN
jgi:hypothetical protein